MEHALEELYAYSKLVCQNFWIYQYILVVSEVNFMVSKCTVYVSDLQTVGICHFSRGPRSIKNKQTKYISHMHMCVCVCVNNKSVHNGVGHK